VPEDGENFTAFVRDASQAFHAQRLQLSIALSTQLLTPSLPLNQYAEIFNGFVVYREPWELAKIAPLVDFVTLMTYGQFGKGTAPGPVAGYAWVEQSIRYALQFVPREKLSLGLGFWAYRWCGNDVAYFGYPEVQAALQRTGAKPQWLDAQKAPHVEFEENGCQNRMWFENRRSLKEKMKLVGKYRLHGFSAWRLGQEDPEFWKEMKERKVKPKPRAAAQP